MFPIFKAKMSKCCLFRKFLVLLRSLSILGAYFSSSGSPKIESFATRNLPNLADGYFSALFRNAVQRYNFFLIFSNYFEQILKFVPVLLKIVNIFFGQCSNFAKKMETENVQTRLKEFIKSMNMTVSEFEKQCKLSQGYVANIRKSISPLKLSQIERAFPNLDISWLLTGIRQIEESASYKETKNAIEMIQNSIKPIDPKLFHADELKEAQKNIDILVHSLNAAYAQLRLFSEMYSELQKSREKVVAYLPKSVVGEL